MNIYVTYASISSITLILACLGFDCRFEWVKPSNRRKNKVEGHVDQRNLQKRFKMTQHRQNPRPKLKHQRSTKCCIEEASRLSGTEPTTGCPCRGHARSCPLPCTTVRGLLLRDFSLSFAAFRFSTVFAGFCPLNCNVSGLIQQSIHSHPLSFHLH